MKTDQRIIALAGLSGAGKTTLVRSVASLVDFSHLSASDLIKEQLKRGEGTERSSESLRSGDILDNQICLVEAFKLRSSTIDGHIVLDCHTIIDTPGGLQYIPASTFKAIGITDFLFLKVDPAQISHRRSQDVARSRPHLTVAELAMQQELALKAARSISNALGIRITKLERDPQAELLHYLTD